MATNFNFEKTENYLNGLNGVSKDFIKHLVYIITEYVRKCIYFMNWSENHRGLGHNKRRYEIPTIVSLYMNLYNLYKFKPFKEMLPYKMLSSFIENMYMNNNVWYVTIDLPNSIYYYKVHYSFGFGAGIVIEYLYQRYKEFDLNPKESNEIDAIVSIYNNKSTFPIRFIMDSLVFTITDKDTRKIFFNETPFITKFIENAFDLMYETFEDMCCENENWRDTCHNSITYQIDEDNLEGVVLTWGKSNGLAH